MSLTCPFCGSDQIIYRTHEKRVAFFPKSGSIKWFNENFNEYAFNINIEDLGCVSYKSELSCMVCRNPIGKVVGNTLFMFENVNNCSGVKNYGHKGKIYDPDGLNSEGKSIVYPDFEPGTKIKVKYRGREMEVIFLKWEKKDDRPAGAFMKVILIGNNTYSTERLNDLCISEINGHSFEAVWQ